MDVSLVRNERTKLIATGLNNIAVATLIAGLIAPFSGFLYGTANPVGSHPWALIGCGWIICGFLLHVGAQ
jgi:ABC-type multidrug transport system permease subunit